MEVMEGRLHFALPKAEKDGLDNIAHKTSIVEGRNITKGELIRRALRIVYGIGQDEDCDENPSERIIVCKASNKKRMQNGKKKRKQR